MSSDIGAQKKAKRGHRGWGLRWTGGAGKAGDTIAVVIVSGLPVVFGVARQCSSFLLNADTATLNGKSRYF